MIHEARVRRTTLALALLLLLGMAGCRKHGDPVRESLDDLAHAAEKRNASAALELIAPDYQGSGSRADVEADLRRYLAAYESLSVKLSDLKIERGPDAARVTFRADLSGTPRKLGGLDGLLPRSAAYRFEVNMAVYDGRWKIYKASWRGASSD